MNQILALMLTVLIFSANLSIAQIRGNGNVVSQKRIVAPFTSIKVNNSIDVYITEGSSNTITVRADENLLPIVTTKVSDGVLVISNSKSFRNAEVLEVHVVMKSIDRLTSSGSGDIYCKEEVPGNDILVQLSGSGDLEADFAAKNLDMKLNGSGDAEISGVRGQLKIYITGSGDVEAEDLQLEKCKIRIMGSGDVELKGNAVLFTVEQSGSGDVNAYNLKAVDVNINNSGSGDIVVNAIENLEVRLNGSGDVTYTGSPKVSIEARGSGDVYKK